MRTIPAALIGICLLILPGAPAAGAVSGNVVQTIKGTDATPPLNGPVTIKSYSKWIYVLMSDWVQADGRVVQFEKMADGSLKFVKAVLPSLPEGTATGSLFFGQFEIKTLPSGKAIAYLNAIGKCENPTPLFRFAIDERTGDWAKLDTTAALGGRMFWTADDRFVYFPGSISDKRMKGFSVDPATGALSPVRSLPMNASGTIPGLALVAKDGKYVYASGSDGLNHKNNYYITVYPRNPATGDVEATGKTIGVKDEAWDWGGGMQIYLTPSDQQIIAVGGSAQDWIVYNRNTKDGSLTQDRIMAIPNFNIVESISELLWYSDTLAFAANAGHHGTKVFAIPFPNGNAPDSANTFMEIQPIDLVLGCDIDRQRKMLYLPCMVHMEAAHPDPAILARKLVVAVRLNGLDDHGPARSDGPVAAKKPAAAK